MAAVVVAAGAPAYASETTTYTYDALGRLVASSHAGSVNNGQSVSIAYDPAGNRSNYALAGVGAAAVISISNASATEGGSIVFTVTRSGDTSMAVGANWATASGTALSGSDFTAGSSTVSFAAGEWTKTVTVATIDDAIFENAESMTVTLSAPTGGASLGTAIGTGTINDNDVAASFAIGNASVTEGGNLLFAVARSGNTAIAASVSYATASGTAGSGSDFTAASGTLNFAANQTAATITVPTADDALEEPTETMSVLLSGASSGAAITVTSGTGSIIDNDSGWLSSLTSGSFTQYTDTDTYYYDGYAPTFPMGTMSNTAFNSFTISSLFHTSGSISLSMSGSATPPNSGWTSITIPGVGMLNRSAASYSASGNGATWSWANSNAITSGTVVIR